MTGIGSFGPAVPWPVPPAAAMPPDGALSAGDGSALIAWALGGMLAVSALALLAQLEALQRSAWFRKRLPVVWNGGPDPRVVTPPRSRAGGTSGRVPPRPAAGSPF